VLLLCPPAFRLLPRTKGLLAGATRSLALFTLAALGLFPFGLHLLCTAK
jgi:hypothetical protein